MKIEYRLRPVTRFIVTRFEESDDGRSGACETRGEYDNPEVAYEVAYALCKAEHGTLGYKVDDERIKYPERFEVQRRETLNDTDFAVLGAAPERSAVPSGAPPA